MGSIKGAGGGEQTKVAELVPWADTMSVLMPHHWQHKWMPINLPLPSTYVVAGCGVYVTYCVASKYSMLNHFSRIDAIYICIKYVLYAFICGKLYGFISY